MNGCPPDSSGDRTRLIGQLAPSPCPHPHPAGCSHRPSAVRGVWRSQTPTNLSPAGPNAPPCRNPRSLAQPNSNEPVARRAERAALPQPTEFGAAKLQRTCGPKGRTRRPAATHGVWRSQTPTNLWPEGPNAPPCRNPRSLAQPNSNEPVARRAERAALPQPAEFGAAKLQRTCGPQGRTRRPAATCGVWRSQTPTNLWPEGPNAPPCRNPRSLAQPNSNEPVARRATGSP